MNFRQKPTLIHVIAWMTLASGVVNLFWGVVASGTFLASVIGIVCLPITIIPTILGVFELIYAAKLFSNPPQEVRPSTNIAVFEIACVITGNVFSMAVGILSLVFYNDTVVKDYFASLNGMPTTVTPVTPAPVIEVEPHEHFVEEASAPSAEEDSDKPKRTTRKTTKE